MRQLKRHTQWIRAVGICMALFPWLGAQAQSYDNPSLGQQPVVAQPQDFKPLGIRAGSFMLHPGVELAGEWNDNVFYSNDNEQSDFVYHVRPYFTAQSTWSRHSFTARIAADFGRFADYSFRDYEDYFVNLGGRIDVKTRTSFDYDLDYMQLHEDLNNRSAEQGVEPTTYSLAGYGLGFDHTFNRLNMHLRWYRADHSYDDNVRPDGSIIDNSDRDRTDDVFEFRLGYQFLADMQAFGSIMWHDVGFDQTLDRNGYNRDSDGYSVNAGVKFGITGVLSGDVYVSYHDMSYGDPLLPDVDGWGLGAGLTWLPTTLTTVRVSAMTDVEQTTSEYASGFLGNLYAVRVDHELLRNLQISGEVSYRVNDYTLVEFAPEGARSEDKYWRFGVGATYYFNRSMFLSASYDMTKYSTNVIGDDFDANRVWLVLGLEK